MKTVHEEEELLVDIPLPDGQVRQLLTTLLEQGVSVLTCLQFGHKAFLITDNPARSATVLQQTGYRYRREAVVLVPVPENEPWAAIRIGSSLHEAGVEITCSYISQMAGGETYAVLQTNNNREALRLLARAPQANQEVGPCPTMISLK
jgi:hypothetical protein